MSLKASHGKPEQTSPESLWALQVDEPSLNPVKCATMGTSLSSQGYPASGLTAASQGDRTSWEKLEKCLEILGRTVRTKFCVHGLLEIIFPLKICCEQLGLEKGWIDAFVI